jgi:hypothetical protein
MLVRETWSSFGFIWNLFEWDFKFESAFKFESKLERGLEENRKGEGDCFWVASPRSRSPLGHLLLFFPRAATPSLLPFPAHRGPTIAGPLTTYRARAGSPPGGARVTSPPASPFFLPSPLLFSPFATSPQPSAPPHPPGSRPSPPEPSTPSTRPAPRHAL